MRIERIIVALGVVKAGTKSPANKLLLDDCIKDLKEIQKEEEEQIAAVPLQEFHVTQRIKFNPEVFAKGGITLSDVGKALRFLVNVIDNQSKKLWVVDAFGKEKPMWVDMATVMPADD